MCHANISTPVIDFPPPFHKHAHAFLRHSYLRLGAIWPREALPTHTLPLRGARTTIVASGGGVTVGGTVVPVVAGIAHALPRHLVASTMPRTVVGTLHCIRQQSVPPQHETTGGTQGTTRPSHKEATITSRRRLARHNSLSIQRPRKLIRVEERDCKYMRKAPCLECGGLSSICKAVTRELSVSTAQPITVHRPRRPP